MTPKNPSRTEARKLMLFKRSFTSLRLLGGLGPSSASWAEPWDVGWLWGRDGSWNSPMSPVPLSALLPQDRGDLPAHVWVQTRPLAHG